jgi:hypothetical protein
VRRRARAADEQVVDVAGRVAAYEVSSPPDVSRVDATDDELVERAVTLLHVLPMQRRETLEALLSPHDPEKGRHAVDALIAAALASEDYAGRLRAVPNSRT